MEEALMPGMQITAAQLIADLNSDDYKKYEHQLQALQIIQLGNETFKKILELFFRKKVFDKIKHLDVCNNGLTEIPEKIGELNELEMLFLAKNQLQALPISLWTCPKLRHLNVEFNQLKNIPEDIGQCLNLEKLYARGNQLERIPYAIGNLPRLQFLPLDIKEYQDRWQDLQDNYMSRVNAIVNFFATLQDNRHGMPTDLLKLVTSYDRCWIDLTDPAPALLEKRLEGRLTALFDMYQGNKVVDIASQSMHHKKISRDLGLK